MAEIWRDIAGYEGLYQVSNLGRVRSLDRTIVQKNGSKRAFKGQIVSQHQSGDGWKTGDGYLYVLMKNSGVQKNYSVHRLVAMAFIPNPENKPEVDHIDGNRRNNVVSNLRWATKSENWRNPNTIDNMLNHLKEAQKKTLAKTRKKIQQVLNGKVIREYNSIAEAGRTFSKSRGESNIGGVLRGKQKTAYGYQWKYA